MPWWFPVGRPLGIPVRVHLSLVALIGVVALTASIFDAAIVASAYACVTLHEYGHAIAARRFGRETRSILLLPIGGIADVDVPEAPRQELVVALAGPGTNVAIAIVALIVLVAAGLTYETPHDGGAGAYTSWILRLNVTLALFNLLPVYPMDGGRVLRALLAARFGRDRATVTAATVGRWGGFLIAAVGALMLNLILIPLGLLMSLAASVERSAARRRLAESNSSSFTG